MKLNLRVIPDTYAVCRLKPGSAVPPSVWQAPFCSVTQTPDELSLVIPESLVQAGWKSEGGWRCLKVEGPLDFALTGILAGLTQPLAEASISIFALSTFDTDYLMVGAENLTAAMAELHAIGCQILNAHGPQA